MFKGITNSQNLVLQAFVSILGSCIIGAIAAGIQYILENGHIDYKILLSVVITAFLSLMGIALKEYVPGHALQMLQAARDTETQVQTALTAIPVVPVAPLQPIQPVKDSTPRESPPEAPPTVGHPGNVAQQPFPPAPPVVPLAATSATMVIQDKTYRVSLEPVEPQGTDVTQKIAAVKAQ